MSQKYVGLDLGTHEVKAVLVSAGLRATQVLEVAVESVPLRSGDDGVSASLEQGLTLLRRRGWNHYRVGVVLPGSAASFRVLKFPFNGPAADRPDDPLRGRGPVPDPARGPRVRPHPAGHRPDRPGADGRGPPRDLLDRVTARVQGRDASTSS
jgi:hypothetical protein